MYWDSVHNKKKLCTFNVGSGIAKQPPQGSVIINESINEDTIMEMSENIIEFMQEQSCNEVYNFVFVFNKYGLIQLTLEMSQENWTEDDVNFFKYDVAMALIVAVRNYRLCIYKDKVSKLNALTKLSRLEKYVLSDCANPTEHYIFKSHEVQDKVAESASNYQPIQPAGDDFMNLPE